jgi:hypothetical protein
MILTALAMYGGYKAGQKVWHKIEDRREKVRAIRYPSTENGVNNPTVTV